MTSGVVFLTAITSTTTGNIVRWGQGAAWPVQWAGVTIQAATGNLAAATAAAAPAVTARDSRGAGGLEGYSYTRLHKDTKLIET